MSWWTWIVEALGLWYAKWTRPLRSGANNRAFMRYLKRELAARREKLARQAAIEQDAHQRQRLKDAQQEIDTALKHLNEQDRE